MVFVEALYGFVIPLDTIGTMSEPYRASTPHCHVGRKLVLFCSLDCSTRIYSSAIPRAVAFSETTSAFKPVIKSALALGSFTAALFCARYFAVSSDQTRGLVTALSEGTVNIIATSVEDGLVTGVCEVTVTYVPVTFTTAPTAPDGEVETGDSFTLTAEASKGGFVWESEYEDIATVDAYGVVTALKAGIVKIYAVSTMNYDGGEFVRVYATITVLARIEVEITVVPGTLLELEDTFQFETAPTRGGIVWSSSDEDVAVIDEDGVATILDYGVTTITATSALNSERYDTYVLTVSAGYEVTLSNSTLALNVNKTYQLTATVTPNLAEGDDEVTWSVQSGTAVTVGITGLVTAGGTAGTATVRATSVKDPSAFADCVVTVSNPYAGWIAISSKATFTSAMVAGNVAKNMYLTADIDLTGQVYTGAIMTGTFTGIFDGCGYTVSNFTVQSGMFGVFNGTIRSVAITCTIQNANHFGVIAQWLESKAVVQDVLFDVTFASTQTNQAVLGRNLVTGAAIKNVIILTNNPSNTGSQFATSVQGGGTFTQVFFCNYSGTVTGTGATTKTDANLKTASQFNATWDRSVWNIVDGSLPTLIKG
jgi:uncharacterized protein YjdB